MREAGHIKRAPRVDTRYPALLTDSDGQTIKVVVTDISRDGCRIESDGEFKIGETVEIHVKRYGDYSAQIRWALGREAGAVFLSPVNLL